MLHTGEAEMMCVHHGTCDDTMPQLQLPSHTLFLVAWHSRSIVDHTNKFTICRAQLVL